MNRIFFTICILILSGCYDYRPRGNGEGIGSHRGVRRGFTITSIGGALDYGRSLAIDGEGRIVVAGSAANGEKTEFVVARYDVTGNLDTRFAQGGKYVSRFGTYTNRANAVEILSDKKILVAGASMNPANNRTGFALFRMNANGDLDQGFGDQGIVRTPVGSGFATAWGMGLLSNGSVVLAGTAIDNDGVQVIAIVKYSRDGFLDSTFGNGGILLDRANAFTHNVVGLVIDGSDRVVVGGDASDGESNRFFLTRYLGNGSRDVTFGNGGLVFTKMDKGDGILGTLGLQVDGKIVAAGKIQGDDLRKGFVLIRYEVSGEVDTDFGENGMISKPFESGITGTPHAIRFMGDGRIVVAGRTGGANDSNHKFALARYLPNGSFDETLGKGQGMVNHALLDRDDVCWDMALQKDGKPVLTGMANRGGEIYDIALARYELDGSFDKTFGDQIQ